LIPAIAPGTPWVGDLVNEAIQDIDQLRRSPVCRAVASDWVRRVVETRDWGADELVEARTRTPLADA
jgi:hypothetical protein